MSEFHLIKHKGVFKAADYDSEEAVKKISEGEVVRCKSVKQRNYQFLKKYWALVNVTLQNLPESVEQNLMQKHQFRIKSKEDVHFYFKIKNGYIEKKYIGKDGNIAWVPKSISFDSMEPEEFDTYFNDALDTAAKLLTVESDDLMQEVLNFM